ncbi:Zinc finger protein 740 [Portunus trituberculatus]|uniref:Zinc finger protein 740 n=1 Tax=Portunus trituberculatus TaxID=210409 RepID=A0A5B7CM85_PORTR|nr:Zinc finger protein 740 [Portunus trituberculatus]
MRNVICTHKTSSGNQRRTSAVPTAILHFVTFLTKQVAIARTLLTIPDQSTSRSSAAFVTSKASLQSSTAANSCSGSFTTSSSTLSPSTPQTLTVSLLKGSSCPECGKVFRGDYHKYNLKKHLTIHAGLRPFTCPVCNMSFNQKVSMKRHFASVHRALGQAQKVDQN